MSAVSSPRRSTVSGSSVKKSIWQYSTRPPGRLAWLMPENGWTRPLVTSSIQTLHRTVSNVQFARIYIYILTRRVMQAVFVLTPMASGTYTYRDIAYWLGISLLGDEFLATLGIKYTQRWRDFGVFLAFTVFNVFLAFVSVRVSVREYAFWLPCRHVITGFVYGRRPFLASWDGRCGEGLRKDDIVMRC